MKQLGEKIIDTRVYEYKDVWKKRYTARGIVKVEDKFLMIHSKFHGDLTFPGGGVEGDENIILALRREVEEEAGITIKNIEPFYRTIEYFVDDSDNVPMERISDFFICEIDKYTQTNLCDYEIEFGYTSRLVSLDEAILMDEAKMSREDEYNTTLIREVRILKELKKVYNI